MPGFSLELAFLVLTAGSSLLLLGLGLRGTVGEARLKRRLTRLSEQPQEGAASGQIAWLRPFEPILVGGGKDREEILRHLRAAGYYDPGALMVFAGLRFAAMLLTILGTGLALWLLGLWSGVARFYPLAAGGVVYIAAKVVLRSLASVRLRRVNAELPFVLDVLLLMLESGISLDQCFRSVAQGDGNAMPHVRQSMRALVEDLQRGMAYDQALDRWADRLGVPGIREVAALFKQTLLYGTELGPALREFVREFSDRRVSSAKESIGRKTTQMTIVMIIFLMPALFIVLTAPAIVTILTTLTGLGR
ncbi:MAG: type II secretion system F family protein [Inquilinus limosus]|uniref:Type II secretion system F family protein n=1 Tax=Inquilinus limosus TaxID=171674 RepID=A0A952FNK0_9PROT|nr:type II secretion system F family protein [Inquilinus limosus]